MELPTRPRPEVRLNLSALIDVIFILLIFVFLVARFIDQERMDIEVPVSAAGQAESQMPLVLYLNFDGGLRLEGAPLAREHLQSRLAQRLSAYDNLLLIADKRLPVQAAVDVLTTARMVGYERVGLATEDDVTQ